VTEERSCKEIENRFNNFANCVLVLNKYLIILKSTNNLTFKNYFYSELKISVNFGAPNFQYKIQRFSSSLQCQSQ